MILVQECEKNVDSFVENQFSCLIFVMYLY